ncbi:MAG TPA: tryptophan--tRNA ligase [Nitrospirae bacterium]|nr:tryptophan--tRNA ligase [bacterium BMS3Abin06]HDH11168.1 tryptophan--tRNA ligase [Nitrospirota bacterium]
MSVQRVLSGIQPSGRLHIGNLVGALQNWVRLQEQYECYYFIADWHALTSQYADTSKLKEFVKDVLVNCLAAGLDPEKATIFAQSRVIEHAELHVLLSMVTPLSWLERVPTYKEKQSEVKDKDLNTYGFLGYPLLQSADILIYRADYVPVGVDQMPHIEITREICRRFNNFYGEVFPEPEGLLTQFPKVVGTDGRKMSKTYNNCVYLSDPPKEVEQKIRTMTTDPQRIKRTDKGDPELSPVFQLHKIFSTKQEQDEVAEGCRTAGIGCIDCKKVLIKNLFTVLEPIWEKRNHYLKKPDLLEDILESGSKKAREVAVETMLDARKAIGLGGLK